MALYSFKSIPKKLCKSYLPALNAFFSKQCFSHITKVFVASTCDFLLIFSECATLMRRNVLSRGFFKTAFFGPVTMATGLFDKTPTYFFYVFYLKQSYIDFILHVKFENVWIVRS